MVTPLNVDADPSTAPARAPFWMAGLAGLVAGAVTVGVASLLAALLKLTGHGTDTASPVIAVGGAFIDRTPGPLKDYAIRTFGSNDKLVLLSSIAVVLVVLAVVAGLLAARRLLLGLGVVVLLGVVAAAAVVTRPSSGPFDVLPTLIGTVLGLVTLQRLLTPRTETAPGFGRRTFLAGAGVAGAVAVVSGGAAQVLNGSVGNVESSRSKVKLPTPTERVTIPAGAELPVTGITPFRTANSSFYRVDTALQLPQLRAEDWKLRIHGMVGKEITIDFAQLLKMPMVERAITLTCVSNEVGGKLAGNAIWLGVPISEILAMAAPQSGADQVLSTSVDGMTISTPLDQLTTGRDALLAIGMNGEALPVAHGFPARLVVPGLYGYVSATKWVTDLKVTTFAADQAYWTPRGYDEKAPIKFSSRIDVPGSFGQLKAGKNAVAGVAWAQGVGVKSVQVRADGGEWAEARLAQVPGKDTWVQWVWEWDAPAGNHTLECRVVDAGGGVQTDKLARIRPNGTSGHDTKSVTVT
jgi:DMSO/TMAO reductase YedYZ molybdopterin-dependent catalytic subunit